MKKLVCTLLALLLLSVLPAMASSADDGVMREGLTAVELTRLMGNGTNLGNTLEACDNKRGNFSTDPKSYETYWGQPVTTQAMLTAMKAAGFDTIRIPVAWMTNATNLDKGDYTIDPAYLARVKEVVDYARNADMYVILNDHWDGGWWGMFGSEDKATRDLALEAYKGMWTQIAEYFRDYSDYVIFESANEELGARFDEDSPLYCSDSAAKPMMDLLRYNVCNQINQSFVDTVRATGGNNAQRFLLIAGYGTNIDSTCDSRFFMPRDSAQKKLLVSVHYYDPWSYCGATDATGATAWGITSDYEYMDKQLAKMAKFVKRGVGVVIGEYGALPDDKGRIKANSLAYHTRFLDLCDYYDLTSCLWDCSGFFVRRTLSMSDSKLAELYVSRNAASEAGKEYAEIQSAAKVRLDEALAAAPATYRDVQLEISDTATAAWIMWNSGDWALSYSVGDTYSPDAISPGMTVTDAQVTGPGVYTVTLDFTGTQQGASASVGFSALAIMNGEKLFPNHQIVIREVLVNGQPHTLTGTPYTTTDDGVTSRVNLYNEWVGKKTGVTATPLNKNAPEMKKIKTISVTFELVAPAE